MYKKLICIQLNEDFITIGYIDTKLTCKINYVTKFNLDLNNYEINKLEKLKNIILIYITENNIKTKNISIIINSTKIILRLASFNYMAKEKLETIIFNSYKDYLPINLNEFILDYKILSQDKSKIETILVASDINLSKNIIQIIEDIKLKPVCIDIVHNCLMDYLCNIDKEEYILVMSYINKIYIIQMDNGNIKNLRETIVDDYNKEDELQRVINFSGFKFNKVYLYSDMDWIKNYFLKYDIDINVLDNKNIFDGFILNIT